MNRISIVPMLAIVLLVLSFVSCAKETPRKQSPADDLIRQFEEENLRKLEEQGKTEFLIKGKFDLYEGDDQFEWACGFTGDYTVTAFDLATDSNENIYVTGVIDRMNPFLARFNIDGSLVWIKTWGKEGTAKAFRVIVDGAGEILVAGTFKGMCDFAPGEEIHQLTADKGLKDYYMSKFTSDGDLIWVTQWGDYIDAVPSSDMAVDSNNNIYWTNDSYYQVAHNESAIQVNEMLSQQEAAGLSIETTSQDGIVCKLNLDGVFQWVLNLDAEDRINCDDVAVSDDGVFLVGSFNKTCDFDPGPAKVEKISSDKEFMSDSYLLKLDFDGNYIDVATWGKPGTSYAIANCVDQASNIYVTGQFRDKVDFDPSENIDIYESQTTEMMVEDYVYLCKYNTDLVYQWTKVWGGNPDDKWQIEPADIYSTREDNIILRGAYFNEIDFNPDPKREFMLTTEFLDGNLYKGNLFACCLGPTGRFFGAESYKWGRDVMGKHNHGIGMGKYGDLYLSGDLLVDDGHSVFMLKDDS